MSKNIFNRNNIPSKSYAIAALLGFSLANVARAQEGGDDPLITDRPDFTESTQTIPLGRTQVEGGFTYARVGDERGQSLGEILVRQPLNARTEVRFEVPTLERTRDATGRSSGLSDAGLGVKVMLSQGSGKLGLKSPRVSLIGATSLPTGSRALRTNGLQPEAKLLLGWDLTEKVALSSNLNYAYVKDEIGRYSEVSASASLGFALSERVGAFTEVYGFVPSGSRDNSRFIDGGFTYLVTPDFQLDARIGFGLGNNVGGPDFFAGFGAARRF